MHARLLIVPPFFQPQTLCGAARRGLEAVKRCERVYLEAYTSILLVPKERLVRRGACLPHLPPLEGTSPQALKAAAWDPPRTPEGLGLCHRRKPSMAKT